MPSNVLAIISYSAFGGAGFSFALLYTPFANSVTSGVAIHSDGRLAEIANDKWDGIKKIVLDTETTEEAGWIWPSDVRLVAARFVIQISEPFAPNSIPAGLRCFLTLDQLRLRRTCALSSWSEKNQNTREIRQARFGRTEGRQMEGMFTR